MHKDLRQLRKRLEAQQFEIRLTSGHHYTVHDASGRRVATTGGTPSDHRAWRNFLADLRRGGFRMQPQRSRRTRRPAPAPVTSGETAKS